MQRYYQKYLKYKSKYIEFKYGQAGGAVNVFLDKLNEEEKDLVTARLLADPEQIRRFNKYSLSIRNALLESGCDIDKIYKNYFDKDNEQSFIYKLLYVIKDTGRLVIFAPTDGNTLIVSLLKLLYSDLFEANAIKILTFPLSDEYLDQESFNLKMSERMSRLLPENLNIRRTFFGYINGTGDEKMKDKINVFLETKNFRKLSKELYLADIFSDMDSCVDKLGRDNIILVHNMIFIYCYNKFADRIQVIRDVKTPTPCKQTIYTNEGSVVPREFFDPTKMEEFMKSLKFKESRRNQSGETKYLATGTHEVAYSYFKDYRIANDMRKFEYTKRCTLSKDAMDRIISHKGNSGCYTNNFLDNIFNQNNREKQYFGEFGLWCETQNIIMSPFPRNPFITKDMGKRLDNKSADSLNLLKSILFKVYILPDNYDLCKFLYDLWQYCENILVPKENAPSWENIIQQYGKNREALEKDPKFSDNMEKLNGMFAGGAKYSDGFGSRSGGANIEGNWRANSGNRTSSVDKFDKFRTKNQLGDRNSPRYKFDKILPQKKQEVLFELEKDEEKLNDISAEDRRIYYIKKNKMNMVVRTMLCDILLEQKYRSLFHLTSENVPKLKDVEADIHRYFFDKFGVDKDTIKIVVTDMNKENCWISIVVLYRDIYAGEYEASRITEFLRTVDLYYVIDMLGNGNTSILDGTTSINLAHQKIEDFGIKEYCIENSSKGKQPTPIKHQLYNKLFKGDGGEKKDDPQFPFLERVGDAYMFNGNWKINRIFPNRISESVLICGTQVCISFSVGPTTKYCMIEINPVTMAYMQTLKNDYKKNELLKFINNRTFLEQFENNNVLLKLFLQDNLLYEVSIKELPCFDCEGTFIIPDPRQCNKDEKMTKLQYSKMTKIQHSITQYIYFELIGNKFMAFAWHNCIRHNFNQVISIIIYNIIHCFYNIMFNCADEPSKKEIYRKFNIFCEKILEYNNSKELIWLLSAYNEANGGYKKFVDNKGPLFCSHKEPFIARDKDNEFGKYLVWYVCFDMFDINVLEEALVRFYNKLQTIKNNKGGEVFNVYNELINLVDINVIYPKFIGKLRTVYLFDVFSLFEKNGKFKDVKKELDNFLVSVYDHFSISGLYYTYYHHRTAPRTCTLHLHITSDKNEYMHSITILWTMTLGPNFRNEHHDSLNHPYSKLTEGTLEHHINVYVQTVKKIKKMTADEKTIILNCPDRVDKLDIETRNKVCDVIDIYLTDIIKWKASANNLVNCPFIDDYFRPNTELSNRNLKQIVDKIKGVLTN